MYGHLVSPAYAMREYKLLMARGGMNQAQTMRSARPCALQVKQPTMQPYCIRVFANTRQFASCHPGTLFLRKLSYQAFGICMPDHFFFCKSLYPITLTKLLHWIVSLQIAMLDIFFAKFCSPSAFCKLSSDHHFFLGSQLTFYMFRLSNVMY